MYFLIYVLFKDVAPQYISGLRQDIMSDDKYYLLVLFTLSIHGGII